jgi:LytS/YehU family sensor histidine kinase
VRYAVAPSGGASAIHIAVTARHEHLTIAITDGGAPDAHLVGQGSGVGLENIRRRLAALYGARARLETVKSDAGFTARLRLPLAFTPAPGVQETGLVACFRPLAS